MVATAPAVAATALTAAPALAFDTAPHFDVTGDALSADWLRPARHARGAGEQRGCGFGIHEARADYLNQVDESDETNNTRTIDVIC